MEEDILNEIDFCLSGEYITLEHEQAIQKLVELYKHEKEVSHFIQSELDKANAEIIELKKMVDLMAQKVNHYVLLEDGINTRPASTEEKIEYFKKKVRTSDEF